MPGHQHEFADVESLSFLHGEAEETTSQKGLLPAKAAQWRLRPLLFHILSYILLMLASFGLGKYLSANGTPETSLLPSQSIFGKCTTSITLALN